MAKKSSIEKNKHREKLVKQYAARRKRLKAAAEDQSAHRRGAFRGALEARRIAAQFVGGAHPQSLRGLRPSARLYRQDEDVAYRGPGSGLAGPDPWSCEVELVRRAACQ